MKDKIKRTGKTRSITDENPTTNYIESFNANLQRCSNHRIIFNSEANEIIVLTACIADHNNTAKKKKEKCVAELTEEERYQLGFEILA